jgi:uncharacterized LabA/DUF88 family protein
VLLLNGIRKNKKHYVQLGNIFSTSLHNANDKLTSLNGHYDADRAPKDLVLTGLKIKV